MINKSQYADAISRAVSTLIQLFDGEELTHSELIQEADEVLSKILRKQDVIKTPEYKNILKQVINAYEEDVGVKTFVPDTIANNPQSKYWLYQVKNETPHSFFERYKLYLTKEGFAQPTINNIEVTCEEILSHCANPKNESGYDKKRGLVIGDVQSGKTANYLGLVNMAYDYGYKIIVLLAGTTNTLREQTQKRTDQGVIGAKSDSIGNVIEHIGVGAIRKEHYAVPFTNQTNDFKKFIQKNLNTTIGDLKKPVVLVVKKVKSILESVSERLQSELVEKGLDSKSILIIDDEADNASLNTARPECDPTSINKAIRAIFNKFPIASYVGYTATPFANIFINPNDIDEDNLDLFPADFITQLNAPNIYFGGRKVFSNSADENPRCLRLISETEHNFLPVVHGKNENYFGLAESLKEAIRSFLLANVVRSIRGQELKHRSMMINITRYNDVQSKIWFYVNQYVQDIRDKIEQLSSLSLDQFIKDSEMKKLYDLYQTSKFFECVRKGSDFYKTEPISWEGIQAGLYDEICKFNIVEINSRNGKMTLPDGTGKKKRFDYENYDEVGARVIAIGGLVLSRGLTLEGLMTSYYSRNAATYDTLLQMCRWFGYRPKYEDLCQVYLTQENIDRFNAVLDAVEDLKKQFAEMKRKGKTPKDFGLMVKESPDTLETTMLITARNKMRGSQIVEYQLNYGGVFADTSKMEKKASINNDNRKAVEEFLAKVSFRWDNTHQFYMASNVSKFDVATLVSKLKIPWVNKKFDVEGLSEYIASSDIFNRWDVVIAHGSQNSTNDIGLVDGVPPVERSFRVKGKDDTYIRIGGANNRVLEPSVFNAGLGLTEAEKKLIIDDKNRTSTDGKKYESMSVKDYLKRRENPIFIIYPICLKVNASEEEVLAHGYGIKEIKQQVRDALGEKALLMAFALGFPQKTSNERLKYRANLVKINELVSNIEIHDEEEGEEDDD